MNILVLDSWLREYLKTKATPDQIKEYLSLSGPSVERISKKAGELLYDIEITSNRPDSMSVLGIAREAAAILPRFGIAATLVHDPYKEHAKAFENKYRKEGDKKLSIKTDFKLNPRWTSIVLTGVKVGPSPTWLTKRLEATGIRPLNNVIDVTNYLMRAYGQPAHVFDFDEIKGGKMILRASRKGEKIVTLDGKVHALPGGDIVIEDGDGRLIDLCGIMGGYNSSVKTSTTSVVLFLQTYNPVNIRKTSMALAHRTEAASLFEKGLDSTLVLPALIKGVALMEELTGGRVASTLTDLYPTPYKPYTVSVKKEKIAAYIGETRTDSEIAKILTPLGFRTHCSKTDITVAVPSWRRDVTIDVDIIEEIARIFGYHNIEPRLPDSTPPVVIPNPQFTWESEIKVRLRDWGFTETYTYSMMSKNLLGGVKAYKISNPLSEEWVYMRPALFPSMLTAIKENLKHRDSLRLFELSMVYEYRQNDLPKEIPTLIVAISGSKFREVKGTGESLYGLFGLPFTGQIREQDGVTYFEVSVSDLVKVAKPTKQYIPIPKYPPIIEDFSFIVPPDFRVGPFIEGQTKIHKLIKSVTLLDVYENKRTFRVTYMDPSRTLTNLDIAPVHQKFLEYAAEKFGISPVI